jgi:hypothetical protein
MLRDGERLTIPKKIANDSKKIANDSKQALFAYRKVTTPCDSPPRRAMAVFGDVAQ